MRVLLAAAAAPGGRQADRRKAGDGRDPRSAHGPYLAKPSARIQAATSSGLSVTT